jgi:RNA 2',3'-cyclic 3'-phosphodiesterase
MRLFTAIELPEDVRAHLAGVLRALGELPALRDAISWTEPHTVHITLKFLGEVDERHLPALQRGLALIAVEPMSLVIDRFLIFPGTGPARVIAANVSGDSALAGGLFKRIEPTVQPLGIAREAREYKPHVTFGRFRRPSLKATAMSLIRRIDPSLLPTPRFTATAFSLIESKLGPGGPTYTTVARFGA